MHLKKSPAFTPRAASKSKAVFSVTGRRAFNILFKAEYAIPTSSAIIAYCPVAIVQHVLQLKRSTYEALQILSISLMDKTPLVDFFERTDFNNVKELGCPLFPGLFD